MKLQFFLQHQRPPPCLVSLTQEAVRQKPGSPRGRWAFQICCVLLPTRQQQKAQTGCGRGWIRLRRLTDVCRAACSKPPRCGTQFSGSLQARHPLCLRLPGLPRSPQQPDFLYFGFHQVVWFSQPLTVTLCWCRE